MSKSKGAPVVGTGQKKKRDKSNKNAKYGRNKSWCSAYRAGCRQLINQRRRLRQHIRRYPADEAAKIALDRIK